MHEGIKNSGQIINGMCEIKDKQSFESKNVPKVVTDDENYLLYMSRLVFLQIKNKFIKAKNKSVFILFRERQ